MGNHHGSHHHGGHHHHHHHGGHHHHQSSYSHSSLNASSQHGCHSQGPQAVTSYTNQTLHVSNQTLMVNHCKIYGNNNNIIGNHNTVQGANLNVTGNHNALEMSNSRAVGNHNKITGSNNHISGNHNKISGVNNQIFGNHNKNEVKEVHAKAAPCADGAQPALFGSQAPQGASLHNSAPAVQGQWTGSAPGGLNNGNNQQQQQQQYQWQYEYYQPPNAGAAGQAPPPQVSGYQNAPFWAPPAPQQANYNYPPPLNPMADSSVAPDANAYQWKQQEKVPQAQAQPNSYKEQPYVAATTDNQTALSDDQLCSVCLEKRPNSVFDDCGHMTCCYQCATEIHQKNGHCPMCRKKIIKVIRVFS